MLQVSFMKLFWVLLIAMMPSVGFAQQDWRVGPDISLHITVPNGGQTPCVVDFEDFIAFVQAYGSTSDDQNYNFRADTNQDGTVNFPDFIAFAGQFGKSMAGTSDECRRPFRTHVQISGEVIKAGRPFENVWIDAVPVDGVGSVQLEKTDSLGVFKHVGLARGKYAFVPNQFGYVFTPDTLWTTVEDTAAVLPTVEGALSFGLMDIQVIRDSVRVPNVRVSVLKSVAGQQAEGPWTGMTDPSGVSAIRIPVSDGASDLMGTYVVSVIDTTKGDLLDAWMSVPIQTADTRRLVLDIGHEASYVPEREYFFYDWNQQKVACEVSDSRLRIRFYDDVDVNEKMMLLDRLGLQDKGDAVFELRHDKGRFAVLEKMYQLKRSGLVRSVTPELHFGDDRVYWPDHVVIRFKDEASEDDIATFLQDVGASLIQISAGNHEVLFADLLSQDVFEVCEKYRTHPLIAYMYPDLRGRYRLLKP